MPFFRSAWLVATAMVAGSCTLGSELSAVPVVSLADTPSHVAEVMRSALSEYGFFYLENHGIAPHVIERLFNQSRAFFEELPLDEKRALGFDATLDVGYMTDQALDEDTGRVDAKEGFTVTNNAVFEPSYEPDAAALVDPLQGALRWPPARLLPDFEPATRAYYGEALRVLRVLHEALFDAMGVSAAERARLGRRPFAVLKQMRYGERAAGAEEVDIGAGAHCDWGSLTVLATDGTPGLQIERLGEWLPVPPRPGALIVNAGDQVAYWSAGELRSSNHRVLNVAPHARFSAALFGYFEPNALVAPLGGGGSRPDERPPETTLEYFHFKLHESLGLVVPGVRAGTAAKDEV